MNREKFYMTKQLTPQSIAFSLSGELDLSSAPEMQEELEPYVNQSGRALILNFQDLQYIDSTGIGILIQILKRRTAIGSGFKLIGVSPKIKRLFDITGISQYLDLEVAGIPQERKEDIV
ncbi:STAS domain-containing protein [Gorillibacterium timonense]|uniref:STAS domain-containing protein n=1 Tax=Gorillibacterium timonense TaxID=1689269 RepID=UPI00071CE7FA|nr:STAS domain-containing protein [Gorillibacterium timonense]